MSKTNKIKEIKEILKERQSSYGNFSDVAKCYKNITNVMDINNDKPVCYNITMSMIACKLARIINGDNKHLDSWQDIIGYCQLYINNEIKGVSND